MIEHIDLVNLSHYDLGFTDHPVVCQQMQSRFLDMAIDLVQATRGRLPGDRFCWACESNNAVQEWWQSAPAERRDLFLELVQAQLVEVCATPFNHGPTMDAREWQVCARWLPDELAQAFRPRTIVQNDVNGFARAGVLASLDTGVEYLWMGLNSDTGGSPVPQPSAFWWEMPDERRIFVWVSTSYPNGYFLFEAEEWRRGPLPLAADTRYRPPKPGNILGPSRRNLHRAHSICCRQLDDWCRQGYTLNRVALSMTNMWRIDNDPPCAQLSDFVAAWNAEGLRPSLALTTPTAALQALRAGAGTRLPILRGEWTSWWANGVASTPRELAASRQAKRLIDALHSPLYPPALRPAHTVDCCIRELAFFDEHTWGSWNSAAMPDCLDTRGQFAHKAGYAYRPLARAELTLGDANRAISPQAPGIHIVCPYPHPFSGWVTLTDDCLRGDYEGVEDVLTGQQFAFERLPGPSPFLTIPRAASRFSPLDTGRVFPDQVQGKTLRLWVDHVAPHQMRSYRLRESAMPLPNLPGPGIDLDRSGWPASIRWNGVPLFDSAIGDFISLEIHGLAPRWLYKDVLAQPSVAERRSLRNRCSTTTVAASQGQATVRDTGPTLVYEQNLSHPRLRWLRRTIEVFKAYPRVQLRVVLNRLPKPESAEVFYLSFPLACHGCQPSVASGGVQYRPGVDQIANSCRDFHAIDGTVSYSQGEHQTILECFDNALVAFGGMNDGLMLGAPEGDPAVVYAVIYNNVWYCNFAGDEGGVVEFSFDLYSVPRGAGFAPQAFAVVSV